MLVTFRRQGESVLIGDTVEITILDIRRTKVKLGVKAPREVQITTRELQLVREQNLAAAQARSEAVLQRLAARFLADGSAAK